MPTVCGRERRELTRSFLVGFTQDKPLASLDAFQDFVGRYGEVGISEFILRWPQGAELNALQRVAHELLPSCALKLYGEDRLHVETGGRPCSIGP